MTNITKYSKKISALLSPAERATFKKLSTPQQVQDFLDSLSINFEKNGEVLIYSPREVLKRKKAHCMEGAVLAATALACQGRPPLLMDFQTLDHDEDHVVAVFKENNLWGAVSKTNHPVLRYRDPVYKTFRELAMSYFHEYYMWHKSDKHFRQKTLRAYSKPFDLSRYKPEQWITTTGDLDWLAEALDESPHYPVASPAAIRKLRRASIIETDAMKLEEWKEKKK